MSRMLINEDSVKKFMYVGFLSMLSDADLTYTKIKEKICTLGILCFD